MFVLAGCSLVAVAAAMERWSYFRRIEKGRQGFLKEYHDCLDVYQTEAAEELCRRQSGPLASIAMAALKASDRRRADLREVIEEAGRAEVPKLEHHLQVLGTVAYIAPLLGLLGTVLGIIDAFQKLQFATEEGLSPGPGLMAGGIWQALITTVAGLILGISMHVIHQILHSRKEGIVAELESASFEILEIVCAKKENAV